MPAYRWRTETGRRPEVAAAFLLGFVVLGFVGRSTTVPGTAFGLVWPAGGVAVLWFLVRAAGPLSIDSALLMLATFGVNAVTGASLPISLVLVATNLLQTLLAVTLLRRWCPQVWGCGGERPLDSPRVLARYLAAAVLATATGALVGMTAFALLRGDVEAVGGLLWFGRNLCSVLVVTTLGLLAGQWVNAPGPRESLAAQGSGGGVELGLACVFTVAMYGLAFTFEDLPLAFPLLAATVWFGLRFPTLLSAWHSALIGVATVTLTLADLGPFAHVESPALGAVLAQFYVMTIVVTALALSTGRDERQALGRELRRTEAEAVYEASVRDAIIGSMTEGLLVVDDSGESLVRNRAAEEVLGAAGLRLTPATLALVGGSRPDGSPLPDHERPAARALRGETVRDLELRVLAGDGTPRILAVSAVPLPRDVVRDRARALVLCRDVTFEHARRQELSAFAGVVAHDLRNPLAAIDGWTEMIADELDAGELAPDLAREFVGRVRSSSLRMRELIHDLLDHATSSSRVIAVTRVDLAGVVAEVAATRHAEATVSCGPLPDVDADPVLVRQVVDNLIGNALKYVAPGEPPRIEVTGRSDGGAVAVSVADRGIGLPAGEHERIFDEFHRAHHRDYEGSGLGLSICRRIVTRHGGSIVASDREDGPGTVFTFTLPAAAPRAGGPEGAPALDAALAPAVPLRGVIGDALDAELTG